jgi:guanine deaminase
MEERYGNLDVGKDADFLRITPDLWEPLARTLAHGIRSDDPERATDQILFTLLMGLREPAIAGVHVQGRRVSAG